MMLFSFALKTASNCQNTSSREGRVWCGFESKHIPMIKVEVNAHAALLSHLEISTKFFPFKSKTQFIVREKIVINKL